MQIPSFSDIQGDHVDYRKLHHYDYPDAFPANYHRRSFKAADAKNGGKTLCLDKISEGHLPMVSVITVTRNHPRQFALPVHCFMNFQYPKEKLQWVIVDDSDQDKDLRPALGALRKDPRVKLVRMRSDTGAPFAVGYKRQVGCSNADGAIFFHLDDDDYQPPYAVAARVKALSTYKAHCVGSTNILCYDIRAKQVLNWPSGDLFGDRTIIPEAGMAYTREFWEEKGWEDVRFEEGKAFMAGRDPDDVVDIPSQFSLIALTHSDNFTGSLRTASRVHTSLRQTLDINQVFPEQAARIISSIYDRRSSKRLAS
jgi:glycosyltransferase involved in cell wall biosynthesis